MPSSVSKTIINNVRSTTMLTTTTTSGENNADLLHRNTQKKEKEAMIDLGNEDSDENEEEDENAIIQKKSEMKTKPTSESRTKESGDGAVAPSSPVINDAFQKMRDRLVSLKKTLPGKKQRQPSTNNSTTSMPSTIINNKSPYLENKHRTIGSAGAAAHGGAISTKRESPLIRMKDKRYSLIKTLSPLRRGVHHSNTMTSSGSSSTANGKSGRGSMKKNLNMQWGSVVNQSASSKVKSVISSSSSSSSVPAKSISNLTTSNSLNNNKNPMTKRERVEERKRRVVQTISSPLKKRRMQKLLRGE